MRLTIDDYAKRFELPMSMVHSKLRAKELNYTIENGIVYILLEKPAPQKQKTSVGTIIALYQKENQQLKEKIQELEQKIDRLIGDKEQMLREERIRIEQLYQSKDEQLKTVLELIHTKLQLSQPTPIEAPASTVHPVEEAEEEDEGPAISPKPEPIEQDPINPHRVSLRRYLKNIGLEPMEKRLIKRRFAGAYGSDIRILQHNGEFYLDLSKFDYSDLLKVH